MNALEKLLRDDLHDVAGSVDIPVSLDAIATEHRALARRSTLARALAVVVGVLLLVGVVWAAQAVFVRPPDRAVPNPLQSPAEPVPSPTIEPTATAAPTPAPTTAAPQPTASGAPGVATVGVFVYYVDTDSRLNLVRELKQVPAATPARGAVEAMLKPPVDPDSATLWNPGTKVLGISKHGDVITIDLSAEAREFNLGAGYEGQMVAQLVYTLTEAFEPTDQVRILVEGTTFETGHNVYDQPLTRGGPHDSVIAVTIDTPAQGAVVSSPVTVTGLATAFEASILWKVSRPDGTLVAEGFDQTEEGMALAPFSFELPPLEPGTYVVTVTLDDPANGEGGPPPSEDKEFTVR